MSMRTDVTKRPGVWGSRAFTLVELLVVVSIIALLIAILLPSLRKAREQAKTATCMANMTGFAKASRTYAVEDPGENMIPVPNYMVLTQASGSIEWGGKSGSGQATTEGDVTTSVFGTGAYRGPAHRPLNPSLYKSGFQDFNPTYGGTPDAGPNNENWFADTQLDLPMYRCPSDNGYAGGGFMYTAGTRADRNERAFSEEGYSSYDHYGTSFVANVFWIVGGLSGQRIRSQSVYLTPLSRVPAPATSIAYQEMCSRYAWIWGDWSEVDCQSDYAERVDGSFNTIPGWHRQPFSFNVAFADGHSSMVVMKGCYRPAPNLGLSNYPFGSCGPDADAYECEQCVTMRGPGWQLDTLPATSVPTPYIAD